MRSRLAVAAAALATTALLVGSAGATHPGTNGVIAFERPTSKGADMYSVGSSGGSATRILKGGINTEVAYSPDGSKIAYTYAPNGNRAFEIYVADADGSNAKQLTEHRVFSSSAAWSPDGKQIAYITEVGPDPKPENEFPPLRLHVIDVNGNRATQLVKTKSDGENVDPVWTADGKRIVFCITRPNEQIKKFDANIVSVSADGGKVKTLTKPGGDDELNPSTSPDGKQIIYEVTDRFVAKQSDLAVMTVNGKSPKRLTNTPVHETNPVFSPDGERIAFTSDIDNRELSRDRLGPGFEVYTAGLDGSDVRRLTDNKAPDIFPDWQPLQDAG